MRHLLDEAADYASVAARIMHYFYTDMMVMARAITVAYRADDVQSFVQATRQAAQNIVVAPQWDHWLEEVDQSVKTVSLALPQLSLVCARRPRGGGVCCPMLVSIARGRMPPCVHVRVCECPCTHTDVDCLDVWVERTVDVSMRRRWRHDRCAPQCCAGRRW